MPRATKSKDPARKVRRVGRPREEDGQVINIRPGVGILSVLRHLNYQPWYALAEFVDNALQSYLRQRDELRRAEGDSFALRVEILLDHVDEGRIIIRDNAAGIHTRDVARAFRPAEIPPDSKGLNEFGMGMKSAACWFAPRWFVRTSALGEPIERTVNFDVASIIQDRIEELEVSTRRVSEKAHYTEIVLLAPFHMPVKKTIGKIREHLADIYRIFLRRGELLLYVNDEPLTYDDPQVLQAPRFNDPKAKKITWRKKVDFRLQDGRRVTGFAALRATASTRRAGFSLFRRERLIQGSGDEGYRPHHIFGNPNSYRYQRVFGELHLDGFDVSHTKDGFQWEDDEEEFLDLLKQQLELDPKPLLRQAENWRASNRDIKSGAEEATARTATAIEKQFPGALGRLVRERSSDPPEELPDADLAVRRSVSFRFRREDWEIVIEMTNNPAVGEWLEISDGISQTSPDDTSTCRRIGIRLALAHPFMVRFAGNTAERIEPLLRVAAGIALAEHCAYDAGVKYASTVRRNLNELLRDALSTNYADPL